MPTQLTRRSGALPDPFGAPLLDLDPGPSPTGRVSALDPTRAALLLRGEDPSDTMQRLLDGDPLDVGTRSQERMWHQAVLLDPPRLKWRALAYCAFLAARDGCDKGAALESFLLRALDESIASLIEEDWIAENEGRPVTEASSPFRQQRGGRRIPPERARRIALEFNLLPRPERRPLFAILVGGQPPDAVARTFDLTEEDLGDKLHALLDRMEGNGR